MNTLVEHFQKRENALLSQLREANSLNQVVEKIQDEIYTLKDNNGEYISNLTFSQARVARKGLAELNQFVSLLTAVRTQDSTPVSEFSEQSASKSSSQNVIIFAAISGGAGGIAGSLFGCWLIKKEQQNLFQNLSTTIDTLSRKDSQLKRIIENTEPDILKNVRELYSYKQQLSKYDATGSLSPVIAGFLLGGVVAVILVVIFGYLLKRKQRQEQQTTDLRRTKKTRLEGVDNILPFLKQKFEAIDSEVASETNKTELKPPTPQLEDHIDLLEFLQSFLGVARREEAEIPVSTNKRIEELIEFLYFKGIEVEFYQPGVSDRSKFEFVPSINSELKEHLTSKPALVKGNQVLLQGRVFTPTS
ncbi:hypothetical protein [Scytonema sp. NUACC26]|uniref:hypothetical protein n=1 Tax=Scytonema sp. NUACC26 TaxID=3140176 RepID=UPI0034DC7B98